MAVGFIEGMSERHRQCLFSNSGADAGSAPVAQEAASTSDAATGGGVPHGEGVVASGDCGMSDHSLPHISTLTGSCIIIYGHRTHGALVK
jgi:hypothetical protein